MSTPAPQPFTARFPALDHPGLRLTAAELVALRPAPRPSRHRPASRRPGAIAARVVGQGMDLREIRAFAEGDDLRRIDPAATARTGQLHVRSFHEDRDDTTLLVADFRPAMLWGTAGSLRSVRAGRLLARLGWEAVARGGSVALLAAAGEAPRALAAGMGATQMQALALVMAQAHDAALARQSGAARAGGHPPDFAAVLAQAQRMVPPGGQVHVATGPDGLDHGDGALSRLAKGRAVTVHLLLDRAETTPPPQALAVSDGRHARFGRLAAYDPAPLLRHLRSLGAEAVTVEADDAG